MATIATVTPVETAPAAPHESFFEKILTVMETIGKDFKKGLVDVEKYLPSAAALAGIIFPGHIAAIEGVVNITALIQSAVAAVEQKWAAAGAATGTGAQKLADVLSIVEPTVVDTLTKAGVKANTAYVTQIVNAVVAILNVQTTTTAAAA